MAEPVLVADLGGHSTKAALVAGGPATMLRNPRTGDDWPGLASNPDHLAALLTAVREEALRAADRASSGPIERLAMVAPPATTEGDQLIAAGEAAGFPFVEMVSGLAVAVLGQVGPVGPVGQVGQVGQAITDGAVPRPVFTDGDLVLVCDLGESWTAGLGRLAGDELVYLGHESAAGGRDLDARLLDDLRTQLADWVEPALSAPGEAGRRAEIEAVDFLRRLKHRLAELHRQADPDADGPTEVSDQLAPAVPPYRLDSDWLTRLAEPGLRWLAASARSLVARATTGHGADALRVARGTTLSNVAAVLLVGGGAQLPNADVVIRGALGRPVVVAPDPAYATLRGAARWASAAAHCRVLADHPRWRVEPLTWHIPSGRARLEAWSRAEGTPYGKGSVLARIRTVDDHVYDLTAPSDGVLMTQPTRAGDLVGPTLIAPVKRPASCLAGDPPDRLQRLSASGEWLLTPDRRFLVECAEKARHVKLWSIPDGRLVNEFVPGTDSTEGQQGRVFISPQGRPSLVAWDTTGAFSVWDVLAGRRLATFRDSHAPDTVLVNESQWRLTAEGEDATSAGRYRRVVATVWDLTTGAKLERVTADPHRRLVGYQPRSTVDGFATDAVSPDGRLRAVPVRTANGSAALALQESTSDSVVFRTEHPRSSRVRMAFTPDGRFLLANWEAGQHSQVDVWEL